MNFPDAGNTPVPPAGAQGRAEPGLQKFISFELGGRLCCVAAVGVAEVVQPIPVAPLPNSPNWLAGLAAYHGEPVAVIEPSAVAAPGGENRGKAKMIVFRTRPNETRFALPIDSLQELILVPAADAARPNEFLHQGRPVTFVDHERLFESFDPTPR